MFGESGAVFDRSEFGLMHGTAKCTKYLLKSLENFWGVLLCAETFSTII